MASPDSSESVPKPLRDKAIRLFTYLRELTQLRTEMVRDLSSYEAVLWFNEIPREPGCNTIAWGASDESELWLEVQKQNEPRLPKIPELCQPWVDAAQMRQDNTIPKLREKILAPPPENPKELAIPGSESPEFLNLEDHPDVRELWDKFIQDKWKPWADAHQRWNKVQQIYGRLFTTYQQQKRLGEAYELVLALGLLTWRTPSGQRVRRHLLVGQADLSFDSNKGTLSVRAGSSGVKLTLETDMLEPGERPAVEQQLVAEGALKEGAESPWEKPLIEPVIRSWVNALGANASYEDSLEAPSEISQQPRATFAPALILRKRTSRALVRLLDEIIHKVAEGGEIPPGIRRICEISEGSSGEESREGTRFVEPQEVYFPLPANDEQRRIIERLQGSDGVVVQGPPGTGKSHTIANLICHLLANGQRVLIASQTPRALKVLKDKIPSQLSALAVSLLGNDATALKDLEDSVLGITERHYEWDSAANKRVISELEEQIGKCREGIASVERRLRELREKESYEYQIAGGAYTGTALRISQKVAANAPRYDWFPDRLNEPTEIPFEQAKFLLMLHAYRSLTAARQAELQHAFVDHCVLPNTETLLEMVRNEKVAQEKCAHFSDRLTSPQVLRLQSTSQADRQRLRELLSEIQSVLGELRRRPFPWISEAISHLLAGRTRTWRELHETSAANLQGLLERARAAQDRAVICPPEHLAERDRLRLDAYDLWSHLNSGQSLGWGPFRPAVVKRTLFLTQAVRVNGRPCATADVLAQFIEHLDFEAQLERIWFAWSGIIPRVQGPFARQVADLEEQVEALGFLISAEAPLQEAQKLMAEVGLPSTALEDGTIREIINDLDVADASDTLSSAQAAFESLIEEIQMVAFRSNSHSVNQRAIGILEKRLVEGWDSILEEIQGLERDLNLLSECRRLSLFLDDVAPNFAQALSRNAADESWDARLADVEGAWAWARAEGWVRNWESEHDVQTLEPERVRLTKRLQDTIAELAAQKAWRHLFEKRLKENHRQHLMAWTMAVKRIGKGTGKRAEKHRRDAQEHMNACRDAIPAWIMPFYRVAESLSAAPGAFDVVIVDEASQSGPETLLLMYLAKRCIIVGDDQQISPDAVGIDRGDVDLLIERHLADIPLTSSFGVESSLFDQAIIRFGGRIVLREHFRCMPEIIRFSNDLCYAATPLLPLRQYPPQRLEPIITRHVPEGYRDGASQSARNKPEAKALVEAICECCRDPRYYGKTFGVISLQGEYQARTIEKMLLERLEPEEIERRELVCGDAYAFQGDERDVIFLSLVAAPNERIGALVKDADKRRFNVAASRARDQLWLFHTATLNDLNPGDMRHKLLSYCLNPQKSIAGEPDWDRCESDFEREVGRRIHARGYRLLLQFEPFGRGGKRIDFVVEGMKGRLAVECDGDYWHGPERYEEDMARQRQLERCGWTFWRIRGSTFYRDPEKSLEPLWSKLGAMGIFPGESETTANSDGMSTDTMKSQAEQPVEAPVDQEESPAQDEEAEQVIATAAEDEQKPVESVDRDLTLFFSTEKIGDEKPQDTKMQEARSTDLLPEAQVREVLLASIPENAPIAREKLLLSAAAALGSPHLTKKLRSRLNKALSALSQAGRVKTDWTNVWIPSAHTSEQLRLYGD